MDAETTTSWGYRFPFSPIKSFVRYFLIKLPSERELDNPHSKK